MLALRSMPALALFCTLSYSSPPVMAFQPSALAPSLLRRITHVQGGPRKLFRTAVLSLAASEDNQEAPPLDPRFDAWVERSAKASEDLEAAKRMGSNFLVKDNAVLYDQAGSVVDPASIKDGASVGILFSCGWCPACVSFAPLLKAYFEAQNQAANPRVQLVFVSSDPSPEDAKAVFNKAQGEWLMLDYNSPLRAEWKKRYGVWAGRESAEFADSIASFKARRSGVPAIAIVDRKGDLVNFVDAEARGLESLLDWTPHDYVWGE